MRQIACSFILALGAGCAPSRATTAVAPPPVVEPVKATPPPPVTDDAVVDGSTFAHDELVFSPPFEEPPDTKERAKQLFREGTLAFQRGDFGAAIAAFTEADRLVPMAALMFNIARVRERMGDLGGARNGYAAALARPDVDENLRNHVHEAILRIDRTLAGGPR